MKADEAIELAKKLRAEGVKRVELDGDEIKALELHEPAPPELEAGASAGRDDLDPDKDPSTAPFVAAIGQLQRGSFKSGGGVLAAAEVES